MPDDWTTPFIFLIIEEKEYTKIEDHSKEKFFIVSFEVLHRVDDDILICKLFHSKFVSDLASVYKESYKHVYVTGINNQVSVSEFDMTLIFFKIEYFYCF